MFRGRFNHPDLDVLDSPLMSSNPLTCATGVPGSALADIIFNDPESWEDTDGEEGDYPEDIDADSLAWLTEEIEKIKAHSAGIEPHPSFHQAASDNKAANLMPPASAVPQNIRDSIRTGLKRRLTRKKSVRPISLAALFQHSDEDFSSDIQKQLSKILESGGIPHHIRSHPLSSALSPPSTSGSLTSNASSIDSPLQIQTASTVAHGNGGESPSPVAIYSASATLSFLEWYGIYPDSPRLDPSRRSMMRQKSTRQKGPTLQIPSPKYPVRPSSLLSPTSTETLMPPPPKRVSSVPPPASAPSGQTADLRPPSPPGLTRSPSPLPAQAPSEAVARSDSITRHRQLAHELLAHGSRCRSASREREASFALPPIAPPPYTKTPSPQPPPGRSSSRTTNNAIVTSTTPVRGPGSSSQDSPVSVRRLPSIPPESTPISCSSTRSSPPPEPQTRSTPTPPPHHGSPAPAPVSAWASAISPPATAPNGYTASFGAFGMTPTTATSVFTPNSATGQHLHMGPRPTSAIRSPLPGPAGPRTRSRGSQDAGHPPRAIGAIGHRPPGLRL